MGTPTKPGHSQRGGRGPPTKSPNLAKSSTQPSAAPALPLCLVCLEGAEGFLEERPEWLKEELILKVLSVPPREKRGRGQKEIDLPICAICLKMMEEAQHILHQIEELEKAVATVREKLREKIAASQSKEVKEEAEDEVKRIRGVVFKSYRFSKLRKGFLGKTETSTRTEEQEETAQTNSSDDPDPGRPLADEELNPRVMADVGVSVPNRPVSNSNVLRRLTSTKAGRVTKPPERFDFDAVSHPRNSRKRERSVSLENMEEGDPSDDDHQRISEEEDFQGEETSQENPPFPSTKTRKLSKIAKTETAVEEGSLKRSRGNVVQIQIPVKIIGYDEREFDAVYTRKIESESEGKGPSSVSISIPEDVQVKAGDKIPFEAWFNGLLVKCTEEGCKKLFKSLQQLDSHVRRKHKGITETFDCQECQGKFGSIRQLRSHVKDEHGCVPDWVPGVKPFVCTYNSECNESFRSAPDLQVHIRKMHTHEKPFRCAHCSESFYSGGKKEAHIEQFHPHIPPLKCDQCPRSFFREYRLKLHMKSHTGERPYLCEICSKSFSQPAYLRYHQTTHEELEMQPYQCFQCEPPRTFANPVNLRLHQKTQHNKVYRFKCEVCSHGANHLSHLRLHMLTHSGEKPHTCDICEKSFGRFSQLKIHLRTHTGERPYQCRSCPKNFTNNSKLRRHEQTHTQVKPHTCPDCDRSFAQLTNLNSHIKTFHTTPSPATKKAKRKRPESSGSLPLRVVGVTFPDSVIHENLPDSAEIEVETEEHEEEPTTGEPDETNYIELSTPLFNIQSSNLETLPFQFQVVSNQNEEGDGQYTEFIIVNSL